MSQTLGAPASLPANLDFRWPIGMRALPGLTSAYRERSRNLPFSMFTLLLLSNPATYLAEPATASAARSRG